MNEFVHAQTRPLLQWVGWPGRMPGKEDTESRHWPALPVDVCRMQIELQHFRGGAGLVPQEFCALVAHIGE